MSKVIANNDVLEVLEDSQEGHYKVWSNNDTRIYIMSKADLEYEENVQHAEVEWGCYA